MKPMLRSVFLILGLSVWPLAANAAAPAFQLTDLQKLVSSQRSANLAGREADRSGGFDTRLENGQEQDGTGSGGYDRRHTARAHLEPHRRQFSALVAGRYG